VAQWTLNNHLDGIDFDLENINLGFESPYNSMTDAQVLSWIVTISNTARQVLGSSLYISHAPQAPYFGTPGAQNTWTGATGGYTGVYQAASSSIDFFNVQFYNQGQSCYVDYNGVFVQSCGNFPGTSISEIHEMGIPLNALVLGKIVTSADGVSGYVAASTINSWVTQAASSLGWNTGIMGWVWQGDATVTWISTIYPGVTSSSYTMQTSAATHAQTSAITQAQTSAITQAQSSPKTVIITSEGWGTIGPSGECDCHCPGFSDIQSSATVSMVCFWIALVALVTAL